MFVDLGMSVVFEVTSLGWNNLFLQERALRLIVVMLKYGPWREAFIAAWQAASKSSGVAVAELHRQQRARLLLRALQGMCQRMNGVDDELWRTSLGRNISHINGPLATLIGFGVVFRCPGARGLWLGLQSKRLCRSLRERNRALQRLSRWVALADDCTWQAPRTCQDWVAEHSKLDKCCTKHSVFKKGAYKRNFLIRGLLLAAMERQGIKMLKGDDNISVQVFSQSFPDQGRWMLRLARYPGMCLREFFQEVHFDGRPELFTMFTCLLLGKGMRLSPQWYRKHGKHLTRLMLGQGRRTGVMRLPVVCVHDVRHPV